MRKILSAAVLAAAVLALAACGGSPTGGGGTPTPTPVPITVSVAGRTVTVSGLDPTQTYNVWVGISVGQGGWDILVEKEGITGVASATLEIPAARPAGCGTCRIHRWANGSLPLDLPVCWPIP